MKFLLPGIALSIVLGSALSSSNASERVRGVPYVFCNVYLSSACFGIAPGDKLDMEIVADFVLYEVKFSNGQSASIYSGFNPHPAHEQKNSFSPCTLLSPSTACKSRQTDNGGFEVIIGPSKKGMFIHVTLPDGDERIRLFLSNIRSCESESDTKITCDN